MFCIAIPSRFGSACLTNWMYIDTVCLCKPFFEGVFYLTLDDPEEAWTVFYPPYTVLYSFAIVLDELRKLGARAGFGYVVREQEHRYIMMN